MKKISFNRKQLAQKLLKEKGIDVYSNDIKQQVNNHKLKVAEQGLKLMKNQDINYYLSRSIGVPSINFTWQNWNPAQRNNPKIAQHIINKAFNLTQQLKQLTFNVFMAGSAGTGKTSVAIAMMNELMHAGKTCMFVSTDKIVDLLNDRFNFSDGNLKLERLKKDMSKVDVLFLDDFGTEGGRIDNIGSKGYRGARNDMQSLMWYIADNRFEGVDHITSQTQKIRTKPIKSTIITSNNTISELNNIYNEKVISRLITRNPQHQISFSGLDDMRVKLI